MLRASRFVFVGMVALAASASMDWNYAHAQQVFNWTNAGGSTWATANNWSGSSAFPGQNSLADTAAFTFNNTAGTENISLGSAAQTVGEIVFSATNGFTISAGTVNLINGGSIVEANGRANAAANDTISAALNLMGSATLTDNNATGTGSNPPLGLLIISGSISGAGPLTITSTTTTVKGGTVLLSSLSNQGFTGAINVVTTTPFAGGIYDNGPGANKTNFGNTSALNFTNGYWQLTQPVTFPVAVYAGGTLWTTAKNVVQTANILIYSGGTLEVTTGATGGGFSGSLSGSGNLILIGATTTTFGNNDYTFSGTAANTLSGPITVQSGQLILQKTAGTNAIAGPVTVGVNGQGDAVVQWLANNQVNGAGPFTLLSSGTGTSNCGQLWLQGHSDTIAGLQDNGGTGTANGTAIVQNQAASTFGQLTVSPSLGSSYTFGGLIRDGTGTMSFGVAGPGQEILTGAETYSGSTSVSGGALTLNGSLSNANINVSGGTFNGSGTITFSPSSLITVGNSGKFDASGGMQWSIPTINLPGAQSTLLTFSSSLAFTAPSPLESVLTPSSQIFYTLSESGTGITATANTLPTWNVNSSGNWSASASWSTGSYPNSSGTVAAFLSAATTPVTVNLDVPVTLGVMVFSNSNASGSYNISSSGGNSIALNNGATSAVILNASGSNTIAAPLALSNPLGVTVSAGTLNISGNISENNTGMALNMSGGGTLLLSGMNTFTGPVAVNSGTLLAGGGSALPSTAAVSVASGATFGLNAASDNQTINSLNCAGAISLNGGTLTVANNGTSNVFGLTGGGTLVVTGSSSHVTTTLENNSGFTGNLTVSNGTVSAPLGGASAFGTGGTTTFNAVTISIPSATENFHITGGNSTFVVSGGPTLSGSLSIDGGAILAWNAKTSSSVISGAISGGGEIDYTGGTGANEFTALTLSGTAPNTFSGSIVVEQGTMTLAKSPSVNAIAAGTTLQIGQGAANAHVLLGANEQINPSVVVSLASLGDLRLEGFRETLGGLSGNGVVGNYFSTGSTLTIATASFIAFNGALVDTTSASTGTLALVVNGSGNQVLNGVDTYTGGTTVNSGTLSVNGTQANAKITVNAGAFNGYATITFLPGNLINVGSNGTFDASGGMQWNIPAINLPGTQLLLLSYTNGGTFDPPSPLNSLLTFLSQDFYSLSNSASSVTATALPVDTWNVDGSGNWSVAGSWSFGSAPNGQASVAAFLGAITQSRTLTMDIPQTVGVMFFSNSAAAYTISGTNSLTLDNTPNNAVILVAAGSHTIAAPVVLNTPLNVSVSPSTSFTISGNISEQFGHQGLNLSGSGTLLLSGSNTFTGAVAVNSGTLLAGGGNALVSTASVSVASGATFSLNAATDNQTIGSLNPAAGAIIAPNGGTLTVLANGSNNVSGLTGSGTVVFTASSSAITQTLQNNSAFSGNLTVNNGSIVVPSASNAFGTGTTTTLNNVTWNGLPNGFTPVSQNFHVSSGTTTFGDFGGSPTFSGNFAIDPGATFVWSGGGNNGVLGGVISGGGTLVSIGAATDGTAQSLIIQGSSANTFSGTTILRVGGMFLGKSPGVNAIAGPLTIGAGASAAHVFLGNNEQINPAVVVTIGNLGDLQLLGFNETLGGLSSASGQGTVANYGSSGSTLTIASLGSNSFGGSLIDGGSGSLALVMGGSGTQILSGANTYSGSTTLNSGTLSLNGSLAHANITVNGGTFGGSGTITFNANEEIVVGAAGTFNASGGMQWNISGLVAPEINLLTFTTSGSFIPPGNNINNLNSLLTPASASRYSLSESGSVIEANVLPNNTWDVNASGNWSNSSNWFGGVTPNSSGTAANFGSVITQPRTVSLDIPVTLGSISFNNVNQYTVLATAGSNAITLNNNGSDASIGVAAGSHLINAGVVLSGNGVVDVTVTPSSGTLTIAGNVSEGTLGTGVLNTGVSSTGTVLLTGSNTFTGGVTVNGGALIVGGGKALAGTIAVNVAAGATFGLSAATDNQTIGSLNCASATAVVVPNGGTLNIAGNGHNSIYGLTGGGTVIVPSGGTQTLGANSAFTGSLTITNGFIAAAAPAASAFGAPGTTTNLNNVFWNGIASTGQNFRLTGGTTTFEDTSGSPIISGNLTINPGVTFVWNSGGGNDGNISGTISGGGVFEELGGAGISEFTPLLLSGALANSFSGATIVEYGTLTLQKSASVNAIAGPLTIGDGATNAHVLLAANEQINPGVVVTIANSGDLRLEGFNETVGGLSSAAGFGAVGNYGTTGSTLTVHETGSNNFGGTLVDGGSASLALVMSGSGTLILGGVNTYSGGTTVDSGTLIFDSAGGLPDGTSLTVGSDAASIFAPAAAAAPAVAAAVSPVPEPGTWAMLLAAAALLATYFAGRRYSCPLVLAPATNGTHGTYRSPSSHGSY